MDLGQAVSNELPRALVSMKTAIIDSAVIFFDGVSKKADVSW
jgi:hypothetical protein